MRNKNGLFIGLGLVLIIALSVGYALFSESIQIKGTARAEGNFNISAYCSVGCNDCQYEDELFPENGYSNDTATPLTNPDGCSFSVNLLYPGAKRLFTSKFVNSGTMDAYLPIIGEDFDTTETVCWDRNSDGTIADPGECGTTYPNGYSVYDSNNMAQNINTWCEAITNTNNDVLPFDENDPEFMSHVEIDYENESGYLILHPGEGLICGTAIDLTSATTNYTNTNSYDMIIHGTFSLEFTQKPIS